MSIKQIADRPEAWAKDWVGLDKQMDALQPRRTELVTIIESIRALDGKTVLPVEITQVIEDGDTLCVENGMDGGHSVGIVVASLVTGGEVVSAKTTEAAIDALAEELRKGKT